MLYEAKTLSGFKLHSRDGEIGKVKDFYFDDHHWAVRYLIAETVDWLTDTQVLISPYAMAAVNKEERFITIELTKVQIEDSPPLKSDKPVSLQFEESYYGYYGWPAYWNGPNMWGATAYIARTREKTKEANPGGSAWNPNLRSTRNVSGYTVEASDGKVGHVEDFVIDDETWAIRYLIVDTRKWWRGKKVLISPQWIERVSWDDAKVYVNVSRDTIKQSPEYTEESRLNRDFETKLYGHFNRQGYWLD